MKIRNLLLGTAASIVAASGAQAADIMVAEPAADYVRVCDAFGTGFFYIPGTETCLKIGGYVRYQIFASEGDDGWKKLARGNLQITASSQTEYGDLTGYLEIIGTRDSRQGGLRVREFDDGTIDPGGFGINGSYDVEYAYITLGGLYMGFGDTLFDGGINGEFDDLTGEEDLHRISYTFARDGYSVGLAIEEDSYNVNYVPNVVAKVSASFGFGSLDLWAAYDDDDDVNARGFDEGNPEAALKARATLGIIEGGELQLAATYNTGESFYGPGYESSFAASYKQSLGERFAITVGGQYFMDQLFGEESADGVDAYSVGTVLDYQITDGFAAKLAVNYTDADVAFSEADPDGTFNGFLRFQRSF